MTLDCRWRSEGRTENFQVHGEIFLSHVDFFLFFFLFIEGSGLSGIKLQGEVEIRC